MLGGMVIFFSFEIVALAWLVVLDFALLLFVVLVIARRQSRCVFRGSSEAF